MPSIDYDHGFYQIAKHYYFPGRHQQISAGEFLMYKPLWEALSASHWAIVKRACGEALGWSLTRKGNEIWSEHGYLQYSRATASPSGYAGRNSAGAQAFGFRRLSLRRRFGIIAPDAPARRPLGGIGRHTGLKILRP